MNERDITICLKLALTVRVSSETADDAEDVAHGVADAFTKSAASLPGFRVMEEMDRAVTSVRLVAERPVRTVMVGRHIGDGVYNDEGQDA